VCDVLGASAFGEQAVMAHAVEAFGQDVDDEAADELVGSERLRTRHASRLFLKCSRASLPGRTSFWFSTALPTVAHATLPCPTTSRSFISPYSPELNPKEDLWDEIREKIFKNYALKSIDAVHAKLKQAILYIERNTRLAQSITSFPYIVNSL
jgi:hypothetical protein